MHKGHRYLFEHLQAEGTKRGLAPLIVTFAEHPRAVLQSDYIPQLLTTPDERQRLLSAFGEVVMLPFEEVHSLTAKEFLTLLHDHYGVRVLLMGYDHRFGSDRLQHPYQYRRVGEETGVEVLTMNEYTEGEWHVSSTEIRAALENGNIALANELLGRPYALSGKVVHGKAVGRTIGYPTANIVPDAGKIIPKQGVYMAYVHTPTRNDAPTFVNIDANGTIEAHIPSFKGDLYDQVLKIHFLRFLREEKQFGSLEELRAQIKDDIDSILRPDA